MIIQIGRIGNNICINKDYRDIKDRGEIAHIIAELELIKLDLLNMFEEEDDEMVSDDGE